jgi:hypothetical protein
MAYMRAQRKRLVLPPSNGPVPIARPIENGKVRGARARLSAVQRTSGEHVVVRGVDGGRR